MASKKITQGMLLDKVKAQNRLEIDKVKVIAEGNIVGGLWSDVSLYNQYPINIKHFGDSKESNAWRVAYIIGYELMKQGKRKITDVEVDIFLDQHPKLRKVFTDELGGFEVIEAVKGYSESVNMGGYITEFQKWWAISKLNDKGWLLKDDIIKFRDYTVEEISSHFVVPIHDIFIHTTSDITTHNLCDDLDDLIDEADAGLIRGIPLHNMEMLDNMIGGVRLGEITMLGGESGSGKTSCMIEALFPTIFELNEQIVVILNEQDERKMRREMITWIINNVFDGNFNKYRWVQGSFTKDERILLSKATKWLKEKKDRKNIIIIPLEKYTADLVVRLINKYSAMGVKYFALDTFKPSTDSNPTLQWQEMTRDSVLIFDAIKPATNNVAMWINLQLVKTNNNVPFIGLGSIGIAKNVVDVASTFIGVRKLWNSERNGGKNKREYIVNLDKREDGTESKTVIKKCIDEDDHVNHHIFFIPKAREGGGDYQILTRNDLGKNTVKELGKMYISEG